MTANTAANPTGNTPAPRRRGRKLLIIFAIFSLLIVSATAAAYWWHNRPITPVVLSASEQQVLDQKLEVTKKRSYQPGGKSITLTEREVNALINNNTDWGDKVHFEFAKNAVHARIRTELDDDIPVVGGQVLKLKARFLLKDADENPAIILDDVTVWGISLPNAWLAEMKGKNLIADLLDTSSATTTGKSQNSGVKDIHIENGEITIELAD